MKLLAFLKSLVGLFYSGIVLLVHYFGIVIKKFWKVIVIILSVIISIITLKAFRKKGGKVESDD